jgi:hypothetical protein
MAKFIVRACRLARDIVVDGARSRKHAEKLALHQALKGDVVVKIRKCTAVLQPDGESCGAAAFMSAASAHHRGMKFDDIAKDLKVYSKMVLPTGTLPNDMMRVAMSYYRTLLPVWELDEGDVGVFLSAGWKHWRSFQFRGGMFLMDPLSGIREVDLFELLSSVKWGFVMRNPKPNPKPDAGYGFDLFLMRAGAFLN